MINDDDVNDYMPGEWIGYTCRLVVIGFVIAQGIMSNRPPVWVSLICFALYVALSGWPVTAVSQAGLLDLETSLSRFTPTHTAIMAADQHFLCVCYHSILSSASFENCAIMLRRWINWDWHDNIRLKERPYCKLASSSKVCGQPHVTPECDRFILLQQLMGASRQDF